VDFSNTDVASGGVVAPAYATGLLNSLSRAHHSQALQSLH